MNKLTASSEDYLKKLFDLQQGKGSVQVKDLARLKHVKAPSVVEALGILEDSDLIEKRKRYARGIELTAKGFIRGKLLHDKYETLKRFFLVLGLEEKVAANHACGIEHEMEPKAMKRVERLVAYAEKIPKSKRGWMDERIGQEGLIMKK